MKRILIQGEIGEGSFEALKKEVERAGKDAEFLFEIDSIGGYVSEGEKIYNLIRSLPNTTTRAVGVCYSIASIVLQAGKVREVAEGAEVMIHNAWTEAQGNASDFRLAADYLEQVDAKLALRYVAHAKGKLTEEKALELMSKETYMTAEEAVAFGIADRIADTGTQRATRLRAVAKFQVQTKQTDMTAETKKVLEQIRALLGIASKTKAASYTLSDGETVIEADSLTEGAATNAPDGTHTLQDGTVIVVAGGVITSVTAPAAAQEDPEKEAMKAEIEALKKQNEDMRAEIAKKDEDYAVLNKQIEAQMPLVLAIAEKLKAAEKHTPAKGDGTGDGGKSREEFERNAYGKLPMKR